MAETPPLQRLLADVCLHEDGGERLANFDALCTQYGVDPEDVAALAGDAARLGIYRRLVLNNLRGVVFQMMPRTRARLGEAFERTLARFLEEVGPRTHYLRDVPHELLEWAAPRWKADASIPAWATDLAAWELVEYAASAAARRSDRGAPDELAIDRGVLFDDATRMLHVDWAVHLLPAVVPDEAGELAMPEARATDLAVYRDAEHAVRVLELSPLAAALVHRLMAGETLGDATRAACADTSLEPTADALASIARLLADFAERGLLLGGAP
jgi:hypothetical protein